MCFEKFIFSDRVCKTIDTTYLIYGKTHMHLTVDYFWKQLWGGLLHEWKWIMSWSKNEPVLANFLSLSIVYCIEIDECNHASNLLKSWRLVECLISVACQMVGSTKSWLYPTNKNWKILMYSYITVKYNAISVHSIKAAAGKSILGKFINPLQKVDSLPVRPEYKV